MIARHIAQQITLLADVYAHALSSYVLVATFSPGDTGTKEADLTEARKAFLKAVDEITVKETP